jgi:hypothetical protein
MDNKSFNSGPATSGVRYGGGANRFHHQNDTTHDKPGAVVVHLEQTVHRDVEPRSERYNGHKDTSWFA